MYRDYKIICFVPAGRRRTMEILFNYFIKHNDVIDEVMLWKNTTVQEDIDFMYQTAEANDLFKVYELPKPHQFITRPIQYNTRHWYRLTVDPDTIYIRFDDDIIFIDDDYFKNIVDFRIEYPEYFVVFGNIVNNAMCGWLQQENKVFPKKEFNIEDGYCMNAQTWGNPKFAIYIHNLLLKKIEQNKTKDFFFQDYELDKARFSISNFAFFGKDFAKFGGSFPIQDEEIYITEKYPRDHNVMNAICGNALVSHYTFSPYQKPKVLETDILKRYKEVSRQKLSEDYYKLLTIKDE